MELTQSLLRSCEDLLAESKTDVAIAELLKVKEQTAYKNDLLNLSSRWNQFSHKNRNGLLSSQEQSLSSSRINNDLLLLLDAMKKELKGEKVVKNLFQPPANKSSFRSILLRTYLPILLTALMVWGLSKEYYQEPPVTCNGKVNLAGTWAIFFPTEDGGEERAGRAVIHQKACMDFFQISGTMKRSNVDFSSKIGGINNGSLYFVYENINGEKGVCEAVVPSPGKNEFTAHCFDEIGFDRDKKARITLILRRDASEGK
ncbi:MAG: hypothetical protein AAFV95_22775 [Bacteroidota bacterium]